MKFNKKLQKLRKEKGMSQESLAEILGVSRQAISKWESGQSYPEMENLITLSELFGVTLDSFIKDIDLQNDNENNVSEPFWLNRGRHYEYKSKKTLLGVPLIHVNIGRGMKKAKGIVAVGNIASGILSVGFISIGILSFGVIGAGLIGIGAFAVGILLSIGAISFGTFAIGAVAVGIFSLGALSIGMFSMGACSIASHIAIGYYANGHIAAGRFVKGIITFVDTSPFNNNHNFNLMWSTIKESEVRQAINSEFPSLWKWIVDLVTFFLGN